MSTADRWALLDVTDGLDHAVVLLRGTREACLKEEMRKRTARDTRIEATPVELLPAPSDCACKGQITKGEPGLSLCTNTGDGPLAQVERAAAAPGEARSVVERSASGRKQVVGGHGSVGRPGASAERAARYHAPEDTAESTRRRARWQPPLNADAENPHSDADGGL